MPSRSRPEAADILLISLVVLTGFALRIFRIAEIPFTHDEFSAILRTRYDSFGDLIRHGVMVDGHPAGVQVFLYMLVKTFGVSEITLKLPFILFGTAAIVYLYLVGRDWFNPTAGLVAAAFLAFLQFPVMYSQLARPYASGLLFCLMMTWYWTRVLFFPEKKYIPNLVAFILTGALCAYNHHFSLLFAGMAGLTGLLFCRRKRLGTYLLACGAVILLYLPHLPVLFAQLKTGGIEGWLAKPRYDFIADFLQYAFHFSWLVYGLVILLIILAFTLRPRVYRTETRMWLVSLSWFLLPLITGFLYSLLRSAVLQYSVMIFSFPFLLLLVAGLFRTDRNPHKAILVILVAAVTIPTLVFGRRHYDIFYHGVYREIVAEAKKAGDSLGNGNCAVLLDAKKEINPYYLVKLECRNLRFTYFENVWKEPGFGRYLDSLQTNWLAFGCLASTPQESYPMILERFPYLVRHTTYHGGEFYLFSRVAGDRTLTEYFDTAVQTFEKPQEHWSWIDTGRCIDSLAIEGKRSWLAAPGDEFSPTYTRSLRDMFRNRSDIIDVSADLRLPAVFPGAWLVVTVTSDGRPVKWLSSPVSRFMQPGGTGRVYLSMRISDVELRHHRLKYMAYLWNPGHAPYLLDRFTVRVRSGNPVIYGLLRKVPE